MARTGQSIFGGVKEEVNGSGGIGQRGENRRGEGNAPINNDGLGMRAGAQSSKLT